MCDVTVILADPLLNAKCFTQSQLQRSKGWQSWKQAKKRAQLNSRARCRAGRDDYTSGRWQVNRERRQVVVAILIAQLGKRNDFAARPIAPLLPSTRVRTLRCTIIDYNGPVWRG
jgi:hypothetical protein